MNLDVYECVEDPTDAEDDMFDEYIDMLIDRAASKTKWVKWYAYGKRYKDPLMCIHKRKTRSFSVRLDA